MQFMAHTERKYYEFYESVCIYVHQRQRINSIFDVGS